MPGVTCESSIDPVTRDALPSFKKLLAARYGERLKSLYLVGSRARGEHRPDSDADVAVFLDQVTDPIGEQFDLIDEGYDILLDTGVNIQPWVLRRGEPRRSGALPSATSCHDDPARGRAVVIEQLLEFSASRKMIPSLVATELQGRIRDFLRTTFPATTPGFLRPDGRTMLDDFLAQPDMLFKGPYLSLGLPFRTEPEDATLPFEKITPGFRPYRHQLMAFRRLCGTAPQATLVATGTGSGKAECFLYPILDHCATAAGPGIKAIVIYPMNALATDQARRFAKEIYNRKELRGKVRVGLFVGDKDKSEHTKMTEDFVITCKETQRETPPDVLLTNDKMLDYLLIRPRDQRPGGTTSPASGATWW